MTDSRNLSHRYPDSIEALLRQHGPGMKVWTYRRRVDERSHAGSGLNLVVREKGLEPLPSG